MSKLISFVSTKVGMSVLGAIVLAAIAIYAFSGGGPKFETVAVHSGDLIQQVSASGKVVPAVEVDLGFTQSGRISRVGVKVGDVVSAGRVLAEIDSGDLYAQLLQREAALDAQKAKLLSLQMGTRPEEIAVAEADVEKARSALVQANSALVDALRDAYITADDAVRNQVYQFVSNPRTSPQVNLVSSDSQAVVDTNSGIVGIEAELNSWATDIQMLDAGSDLTLYVARSQARMGKVSSLLSTVSRVLNSASATNVTQTTLDGYISDVATARASVSTAASALTTAVTAQKSAAATLQSADKALALKKAGTVQADIDAQAAQVKAAEADVANARSLLAKTVISAPFSGVITKVDAKPGKIVSPNTPEISMDSSSNFQVESYVPEVNIAFVKVGDTAVVTLDAYGDSVPFAASVVSIDPAETVKDGVPTYRAVLQFMDNDERIRSGMTANLVITTATREGAFSVPQGLIVEKDWKKYVRVLEGEETVVEKAVTTGIVSSLGEIEILTGLNDGDLVIFAETQ